MFKVTFFWSDKGQNHQQTIDLPSIPSHGDQVIVETGYEGTVASRLWLMDRHHLAVHVVLS